MNIYRKMFFFYAEKEVNLLLKGEEKMQKKTMISISERENVVSLRTYSRDHQCSNNFFLLKKEIQQLMSERTIIVKDICSFAELRCREDVNCNKNINIQFWWLHSLADGRYEGYEEVICLPQEVLFQALHKTGYKRKLLSISQTVSAKIEFRSRKNLKDIISRPRIRHKFTKFLEQKLNWENYERFVLYDDFLPYSFLFDGYTPYGPGISGGIILHGQNNLNTAYYSIHT